MPLSKIIKSDIRGAVVWTAAGDSCFRCGLEGHVTQRCDAPIDVCWKDAIFTDPTEAEELYQTERKKVEEKKQKNAKINAQKAATKAATGKTAANLASQTKQPAPKLPATTALTGQLSSMAINPIPSSKPVHASNTDDNNTKATKEARVPIADKDVGKIDRLTNPSGCETRSYNDPAGANMGLYQGATDDIDGNTGGHPAVRTNYVRINAIPEQLFAYSLRFYRDWKDNEEGVEINKEGEIKSAFEAFMQSNKLDLANVVWATDYKELWCTSKLPIQDEATFQDITWNCPGGRTTKDLKLDMGASKCMRIHDAFKTKASCDLSDEIRALNAIIASAIKTHHTDLIQVGANKFFVKGAFSTMAGGLRAQRGYFTSILPSVSGPLLNVNTGTAVFLPPILVSDFLANCVSDRRLGTQEEVRDYVEMMLKKRTVRIIYWRQTYEGGKDMNTEHSRLKVFRNFGATVGQQKFYNIIKNEENEKVADPEDKGRSVLQWFKKEIKLDNKIAADTLCVNVGLRAVSLNIDHRAQSVEGAIWIPANLLEIVPDQTINVELCEQHDQEMIGRTVRTPGHNAGLIDLEGLVKLGIKGPQEHLKAMDVSTGRNMIKFGATKAPQPQIAYSQNTQVPLLRNAAWNLANVKFAIAKPVGALHVLACQFALGRPGTVRLFAQEMEMQLEALGMRVGKVRSYSEDLNTTSLCERLSDWFPATQNGDCTIVVLQDSNKHQYAAVKRAGDITFGQHTSCFIGNKIKRNVGQLKGDRPGRFPYIQHLSNLAMKVNLKMGGDNHHVDIQGLGSLKATTIVLGADVTHPGNDNTGRPSIACVVGSIDENFMNYPGSMRLQAGGQERIQDMHSMVQERLKAWSSTHSGLLPSNMLFYRDGVSNSQFRACEAREIPAIRSAYTSLCTGPNKTASLNLTFVVVTKRHNTRFYPTRTADCTKIDKQNPQKSNMNVAPGLLVDRVITDSDRFNFYLQSHQAIKGTARSAHYHALVDEIGFGVNKEVGTLTNLTHQLCYAFGRATRAVSYVSPAYIADRLCERGRVYLRGWLGEGLPELKSDGKKGKKAKKAREGQLWEWKQRCAMVAMREVRVQGGREKLWGWYNDDPGKGEVRLNPWHRDMDGVMFWM